MVGAGENTPFISQEVAKNAASWTFSTARAKSKRFTVTKTVRNKGRLGSKFPLLPCTVGSTVGELKNPLDEYNGRKEKKKQEASQLHAHLSYYYLFGKFQLCFRPLHSTKWL